jgi:16S rRNA (adenine1518-N6/adenine1519-N6)-dimethyltransferase
MARQHLGQHFLADSLWREQIAQAIRVWPLNAEPERGRTQQVKNPEYCWIEIGPGHGEMTEYLAATAIPVIAIELDRNFSGHLNRLKKKFANLEIVHADILESDLRAMSGGRRMRVYGSLPYYITSPILHHLFLFADLIDEIHVVVQTEVAERMAAEAGSKAYGYLSVATQLHARPEVVLEIPRAAFNPPPEVGSTLVTLRLPGEWPKLDLPAGSEEEFLDFVKLSFSKKRKTLVNNLRESFSPESVRGSLGGIGSRLDARAEQIAIQDLGRLFTGLRLTNS